MARPSVCIFQESLSKTDRCCTCLDYRQEGHCSWHTVGDQITWFRQCPSDSTNLKMRRTSAAQSRWMYAPRAMQMHGLWTIIQLQWRARQRLYYRPPRRCRLYCQSVYTLCSDVSSSRSYNRMYDQLLETFCTFIRSNTTHIVYCPHSCLAVAH